MLNRIKCLFGFHKYYVKQKFNNNSRRLGCKHCNGDWAMADRTKTIIPWDSELEEFYKNFEYEYEVREEIIKRYVDMHAGS